jgi:DNA polymerase III subunit epsilon
LPRIHPRTIIIDFETSGLSPNNGDRVIEVGAVAIEDDQIVDRFQSLVHPGFRVNSFIQEYTGITNKMLDSAPTARTVIPLLVEFIADHPLVAHNASFDQRFLDAELARFGHSKKQQMACSMLISRRVNQNLSKHSLEYLVGALNIPSGDHHRALADAEMTAHLYIKMVTQLKCQYDLQEIPFDLLCKLSKISKANVDDFMRKCQS